MSELAGKVVVVTGASQGIGRALVALLAERGAKVVLAARDAGALDGAAAACRARGAEALAVPTDISEPEACRALVAAAVDRFGAIDALVLDAGIDMIARFDEVTDLGIFERLMRVNYLGSVYPTYFALPHLKRARGRIVAVSSLSGLTGVPTRTGYAASKHAQFGFFDSLRVELRGTGVSVTMVAPDFVETAIHVRAAGPDGRPHGRTAFGEGKVMSAAACARRIADGMERRKRLLVLSFRGKAGRWVRMAAPGLIDAIAERAIRDAGS